MKRILLAILLLALVPAAGAAARGGAAAADGPAVPVIVMTHPTLTQVRNLVELYQKDVLPLESFTLLGIYHEDELANLEEEEAYREALAYVEANGLSWVRFRKITGRVEAKDLFRENAWSRQFREIFDAASGFVFTGGMDIPPALYGHETLLLTEPTTPARHLYEISLLFHLLGGKRNAAFSPLMADRRDMPVLAICLGMQSLNVALGGTLVQDIPSQLYGWETVEEVLAGDPETIHSGAYLEKTHPNDPDLCPPFHRIRPALDSLFFRNMGLVEGATPWVSSSHHQAIEELGKGLRVTATSLDGMVAEAVELAGFANVLGVQFHPERHILYQKGLRLRRQPQEALAFNPRSFLKENTPSYEFHLALWKWFAEAVLGEPKLGARQTADGVRQQQ